MPEGDCHGFLFVSREHLAKLLEEDEQEQQNSLKFIQEYTDLVSENVSTQIQLVKIRGH